MKIMHVDASPKYKHANSRALSQYFISQLRGHLPNIEVDYLDLAKDIPAHTTELFAISTYTPAENRTAEMKAELAASDRICQRLMAADALVFAMPMYNFSIPSLFKAFIDNIVRTGLTYVVTPDGDYVGQLSRQKVLFITTRGADFRPGSPFASMDALTPALRAAFGFIGVADPQFVDAQPLQFADQEARQAALDRAEAELTQVAEKWAGTRKF